MKTDGLSRRLTALEGEQKQEEDLVCVKWQWVDENGTPKTPLVTRWIPRSKHKPLEFLFKGGDECEGKP